MMGSKLVPLGDYIMPCDERNSDLCIKNPQGISNLKFFQTPKQVSVNSKSDKIVRHGWFAYNRATTRNGEKISIAYREGDDCTVSSAYQTFYIKDTNVLDPYYLWMFFRRPEFDRYARYMSKGSAHEFFEYDEMCRVQIPLPSIDEQRKVVNAWKAFMEIKEQNEGIYGPLMQVCQSYIQELKKTYKAVEIGEYIEPCDERNDGQYTINDVKGVSIEKKFIDTKANMENVNISSYKLVKPNYFCFVPVTSRNGDKITIALNSSIDTYLVSTSYETFRIKDENEVIPEFLQLWFRKSEFDRYARFNSWGSARESFPYDEMERVRIPLPPIDVQRAIVNIYNCANEAKRIAEEADRKSREICPALIQYVIHR